MSEDAVNGHIQFVLPGNYIDIPSARRARVCLHIDSCSSRPPLSGFLNRDQLLSARALRPELFFVGAQANS